MFNLIDGPVGPGEKNDPDNLRVLWSGLTALDGAYRDPDTFPPLITADFDDATRKFQADHGLYEDGRWLPGGESERNLVARLTGDGFDRIRPSEVRLRGSIGDGGDNRPDDVVTGKRLLASLGEYRYDRTRQPSPYADTMLVDVIRDYQRRFGLPVTGLIDVDSEDLRMFGLLADDMEDKSREEIQVAALPLLALIWAGVNLGMRVGGVIARRRAGDAKVIREIEKARREISSGLAPAAALESARRTGNPKPSPFTVANEPAGGPLVHEQPDPKRFGGNRTPDRTDPPDIDKTPPVQPIPDDLISLPPNFPLPQNPEDFVEVFPDQGGIWSLPIVKRKGSEKTRSDNTDLARLVEEVAQDCGIEIKHVGGARTEKGEEKKEFYLRNRETQGRKGSNFLDISFELVFDGIKRHLHINTVDTHADGMTRTTREENAAGRIMSNMEGVDFLVLIQKIRDDEMLDRAAVKKLIKPILEEMAGRPWKGHHNKRPSGKVYHTLKKRMPRAH